MILMVPFMMSFSSEMSWMRSGTELSQFLRVFLPTFGSFLLRGISQYQKVCMPCMNAGQEHCKII